MEYHLNKRSVSQRRNALDTASEQSVDFDLTLPDYCPDIERILSCTLDPKIYIANVSGDRLNIEGGACVRVMYADGDSGCVRSYEYTRPFSESLPLKESISDCAVYVEAKPEYLNCRALSPRKLSLHGAFTLYATVAVADELDYYTAESGDDLQVKGERMEVSSLCGLCTDSFNVQEDIPFGERDEVNALLSHRLTAKITELKAISGKIMLSAELKLDILYLCGADERDIRCMTFGIPVSRVIDCAGADEDAVIDGELTVMSDELHMGGNAPDGSSVPELEAKLSFNAMCYREEEIEVLADAFSTDRDTELRFSPFSCKGGIDCRSFTDVGRADLHIDDEIGKITDVRCTKISSSHTETDGSVLVEAKLCIGILYENGEGETRCAERDAVFTMRPDIGDGDTVERLRVSLDSLSYRLTDSHSLEVRAELSCRMTVCRRCSCSAVTAVIADDDAPQKKSEGSLILYYADGGDSIWDISKRFCSRPADIIAENGTDGDTVGEGTMLLIPTA